MEELLVLRHYIEQQRYTEALDLLADMEEMSREDKVNKIYSFAEILLLHLIKQRAEQRTTRSCELSIRNAALHIARTNKRSKLGGTHLSAAEVCDVLTEAYQPALARAALEAFESRYDDVQLGPKVDRATLEQKALELIIGHQEG